MDMNYNDNTNYFFRYLKSFDKQNELYEINIFTVRHLLEEIKLEFTLNDNNYNAVNINMLVDKLSILLHNDFIITKSDKVKLTFLMNNIQQKNNQSYICSICDSLLKEYTKKKKTLRIITNLINLLIDDVNDNSKNIKELVNYIMVEFEYYGFKFYETKKIILDLTSNAKLIKTQDGYEISTNFPYHYLKISGNNKKDICEYINKMTIFDKLKFLSYYLSNVNKVYYLIVTLDGINVDKKRVLGKNITIYNPLKISMINNNNNSILQNEIFRESDYNSNNANAIVHVKANNINMAINNGIKYLESYLYIYNVIEKNSNIIICRKRTIILNSKKQLKYSSYNNMESEYDKNEFNRKMRPLKDDDFNKENHLKEIEEILNNLSKNKAIMTETDRRIMNSLKKYSEALEISNQQEKILKLWSCIESLFDNSITIDKIEHKNVIITKVVAAFMVYFNKYKYAIELYYDLRRDTNIMDYLGIQNGYENIEFKLPKKLLNIIFSKTRSDDTFSLEPLTKNCNKLLDYTNSLYYKNKIEFINNYYNDIEFAKKQNNIFLKNNKDIISNCYRLRNQIIHNANSNEITTDYYLEYLKVIVGNFLFFILKKYRENSNYSISQIILDIYSESNLFFEQSKIEKLSDFIF